MTTPTLTEFLLARIAEDEEYVRGIAPARVLAEFAAHRRIVELHAVSESVETSGWTKGVPYFRCAACDDVDGGCEVAGCNTLRALAAVYADHPQFRQDWRREQHELAREFTAALWDRDRERLEPLWQEKQRGLSPRWPGYQRGDDGILHLCADADLRP